MKFMFLTPEQVDGLRDHLTGMVPESDPDGADLDAAVLAIDRAASACARNKMPSDLKRQRHAGRVHVEKLAAAADQLRELLDIEFVGDQGIQPLVMHNGAWPELATTLRDVAARARGVASMLTPQPGERRPPDEHRDILISVIFSVYPPGTATKSRGSHFEQTVEMVLGDFLGRDVEVHGLIRDALRRQPKPPFVVRNHNGEHRLTVTLG